MYILKISGMYSRAETPEATMADMLRYDDGEMISYEDIPIEGLRGTRRFTALVHSNRFTPGRWRSFMLKAEHLGTESGKAGCSFPDQASVHDFIEKSA